MKNLLKHWVGTLLLCLYINYLSAQTNIIRVEYYVDTDPGYGNATTASVSVSPDVSTSFILSTESLATGLHIIGVRSKNASGVWSMDERWLVLKQATTTTAPIIERAEWYIDTDPGYGNATPIGLTQGQDLPNLSFQYNAGSLQPGLHIIGIRSKATNSAWSMDERWLILKPTQTTAIPDIERVEWYTDSDPGYGNATPITITPGQDLVDLSFQSVIGNLSPGLHIIGVRSRNTAGAWSFDERWLILKNATAIATANIDKVEWYIDTDPGYDNATPISLSSGPDVPNLSFTANVGLLAPGLHIAGIRSKSTSGTWSMDERWLILKQAIPTTAPNLKRLEYYIDADPGKGRGIPIAFFPAKDVVAPPAFVNITGLSAGPHKILIRSQDSSNVWSFDDTLSFTITAPMVAPLIVVNSVATANVCTAGSFLLGYHATGIYNIGNQFIAEISDSTGNFTAAQAIGSITSTDNGGLVQCNMPSGITGGNGYKMRVRSTNPPLTSNSSNQSLSVSISNYFLGNDTFAIVACAEDRVNITQFYNPANSVLTWSVSNPATAPVGIHSVFAINSVGCKDTAIITVKLPIAIWTGVISSNWHTPGNWNINAVPADTTHVIIPAETPNECIISTADAVAASVHVKAGAAAVRIINNRKLLIKASCATVPE